MGHAHELDPKGSYLEGPALRTGLYELGAGGHPVLVQLRLHEAEGEAGAVDPRHLHLPQEVGKSAHVVLVGVREDHADEGDPLLLQVREVGQHEIDPEMLVPGEREPGVDEEAALVRLEQGHVLADLAQPAQRDDAKRRAGHAWIVAPPA